MSNPAELTKRNQEQAVAAWVSYLNQLRLDNLLTALREQGQNLRDPGEAGHGLDLAAMARDFALQYKREDMDAPAVVAKGVSGVALRIRAVAGEHNVPIVENPPLARALYRLVEIDDPVPPQLYLAVAEVLAYVYGLKRPKGAIVPA